MKLKFARLLELESVIESGLKAFIEVGNALLEIRDSKLYRQDYKTFEDYCRKRWSMSYRRAAQLMDAAEVVLNLNNCSESPTHESQLRPLAGLEPEEQREAWKKAVETAEDSKGEPKKIGRRALEERPQQCSAETRNRGCKTFPGKCSARNFRNCRE